MTRLFLYSGFSASNQLDEQLKTAVNAIAKKSLVIFPSDSDNFQSKYIYPIIEYYKNCGFKKVSVCLYSQNEENVKVIASQNRDFEFVPVNEAFKFGSIFLSGGNTYYFLNSLQKGNLLSKIKEFALAGNLLIGLSAGSMLMQSDISNCAIPAYFDEVNLFPDMSLKSLNLFSDYFFPHFNGSEQFLTEVQEFANSTNRTCYICKDNEGVYICDRKLMTYGNVVKVQPI